PALTRPPPPQRRECPEERLRVARVRAQVVVPEHDRARRARGDLAHDLVDGAVTDGAGPVEERDRTVVAAVGTAPRRDRDRFSVAASLDEIPARDGHAGERRPPGRDVHRLEPPASSIIAHPPPTVLR